MREKALLKYEVLLQTVETSTLTGMQKYRLRSPRSTIEFIQPRGQWM